MRIAVEVGGESTATYLMRLLAYIVVLPWSKYDVPALSQRLCFVHKLLSTYLEA